MTSEINCAATTVGTTKHATIIMADVLDSYPPPSSQIQTLPVPSTYL